MAQFPVSPEPGLWLRGLRFAGHLAVSIFRIRARIVPGNSGVTPRYGPFDVPLDNDRAIVGAYAHPFVAAAISTGEVPESDDDRVVRPVCAIRGPRSLEVAIPLNADGDWPQAMDGTLENGAVTQTDHYTQETPHVGPVTATLTRPQRIQHVRNLGVDPDVALNTMYSLLMNSGSSIRISQLTAADAPVAGDQYPSTAEEEARIQVGKIGRDQELAYPPRNMYAVPVQGDEVAGGVPLTEANHPDTVVDIRIVEDLPSNPGVNVQKVTLNSGATVRVAIDVPVTKGQPLGDPSAVEDDPDAVDPNEWVEFDVLLITAQYATQPGAALSGEATGMEVLGEDDETLAKLMAADPWAIFPSLLQEAAASVVVPLE